jgi:endonuclease/exonuclease/phosphatase family metal-dependent hydrolase
MKKITLLLAFFICLNISLNAQTYPKKENVIRLLTYNTHYCKGGSDPGSIDDYNTRRLASVIEALDPDVVALQELDSAMSDRRRRDLLKQISEFTGLDYQHFFGGLAPINGGKVGPGLLFKKDLEVVKKKIIPLAGDEARSAVRVDFEKFTFMGTHLDLNDAKRTQSASTLVNETDFIRKPCFLAGDLNDSHRWSNGGIAFPVLADKFSIVSDTEGNTIPGRTDNGALIDYILFKDYKNSGIKIVETHIVRTLKVNGSVIDLGSISDHYPVYVDIEIPGLSGIENATRSNSIQIYPTQVQNTLNIQSESPVRKINIYSMTGQKQLEANNPEMESVDISSLPKGIYIVEIFADNGTTFKGKIIKR